MGSISPKKPYNERNAKMKQVSHISEVTPADIGKYIIFGGMGVVDRLKFPPSKYSAYKIVKVEKDGLTLKGYRRQTCSFLPEYNFCQQARIYSAAEYKTFPVYA
jgi:hypothetical protein